LRLAIASSSKRENVAGLLRANLGPTADTWFDVIASGEVVAAKKPAPDLYLWALRELALPARDCLAVEDSAHGLAASLAAGIPTVVTVSDYTLNENFDGARMVLHESKPSRWSNYDCGTPRRERPERVSTGPNARPWRTASCPATRESVNRIIIASFLPRVRWRA